jgi:hypothetical protein
MPMRTAMTKACVLEKVDDLQLRDIDVSEPFTPKYKALRSARPVTLSSPRSPLAHPALRP